MNTSILDTNLYINKLYNKEYINITINNITNIIDYFYHNCRIYKNNRSNKIYSDLTIKQSKFRMKQKNTNIIGFKVDNNIFDMYYYELYYKILWYTYFLDNELLFNKLKLYNRFISDDDLETINTSKILFEISKHKTFGSLENRLISLERIFNNANTIQV